MKKIFFVVSLMILATFSSVCQEGISKSEGTRQIHLDFHTSELIEGIGKDFSKTQFQSALKEAEVNSINIFAKGHHGWCYYDTKAGKRHPHLDFDLLQAQIEACHEIGVRAQAYFTIGWSAKDAREHPEWVIRDEGGNPVRFGGNITDAVKKNEALYPFYAWETLSPEGAYLDLILKHVKELVKYDLDGIWFDIIPIQYPNYSELGLKSMKDNNVDPDDALAAERFHVEKMKKFMNSTRELILEENPDASIFYNWTTHFNIRQSIDYGLEEYNTKLDLEDLPTTWDGYDLFPLRMKYYANKGMDCVAMSGKFHTAWGEFGGFKHKDAILYEAASMVSFGAHVNIGDQLHPSGLMDVTTYSNIGHAFDYVEQIEEYGVGGKHVASTGLWFANNKVYDEGTVKMLLENQVNFVIANNLEDWTHLEVIILSGGVKLTKEDADRLQAFVGGGGKLLVMGEGALDRSSGKFMLDIGAEYMGQPEYDIDYTVVSDKISDNLGTTPFLNYEPSIRVRPQEGTEILARIREPYFNRRMNAYSSHRHTPFKLIDADHPAVIQKGNIVYIARPLGKSYFDYGARIHRDLFYNCLQLLRKAPLVETDLPSAGRMNLLHQPEHNRYVVHLLYAPPLQRGEAQVIEDLVPLYNTVVRANLPEKVKRAYKVPGRIPVEFGEKDGLVKVHIPEFRAHTALVLEY